VRCKVPGDSPSEALTDGGSTASITGPPRHLSSWILDCERWTSATTMDDANSQIFSVNPYEDHPNLTQIEADVLWEYAKLNQHIKDVRVIQPSASYQIVYAERVSFPRCSWSFRLAL